MKTLDNILKNIPLAEQYIELMKACIQDKKFHAEGDVFTHSLMVLEKIEKIIVRENLNEFDSEILRYSAFLHDIGKVYCTKLEGERIISVGHSKLSYNIALELLYNSNLSFDKIRMICEIIKCHGWPSFVIERETPEKDVIKMSHLANNRLLYFFAEADITGRISNNYDELLIKLEYFKEQSELLDCFNSPYKFTSNHARYIYFNKGTHYHTAEVFDDYKSKVYMMSGIPGSGKDYYIKKYLNNLPVISLDDIRKELKIKATDNQGTAIQLAKERAREYLRKNEDFIWNATNTIISTREQLINLFDTYKAKTEIIFIYKSVNEILKQNSERETAIPEKIIHRLIKKLDIPTNLECDNVNYA